MRKDGDVEKGEGEGKKRKSKKTMMVKDKDGPILEERDPVKPAFVCGALPLFLSFVSRADCLFFAL